MRGVETPRSFVVQVPATSANLGPGFDCLGLALSLYNRIEVRPAAPHEAYMVEVSGEGAGTLTGGPENMVFRAMRLFAESRDRRLPAVKLRLQNEVPLGRGMGSSATAIVGGLVAAATLLDEPCDLPSLLALALRLESHPDNVVAALYGGLTLGLTTAEGTVVRRFDLPDALQAVVLIPELFSSTLETRAALADQVKRTDAIFNLARCALLVSDLTAGRFDDLAIAMDDRLHQPQRTASFPFLPDAISAAREAGAHGVALSGAGSSVIALATAHTDRIAQALRSVAECHSLQARVLVLRPEAHGVRCL